MNVMETKDIANVNVDALFERISALIEESRKKVATADTTPIQRQISCNI